MERQRQRDAGERGRKSTEGEKAQGGFGHRISESCQGPRGPFTARAEPGLWVWAGPGAGLWERHQHPKRRLGLRSLAVRVEQLLLLSSKDIEREKLICKG